MKGLACFALLPAALAGNQANLRSRRLREHAAGDAAEVAGWGAAGLGLRSSPQVALLPLRQSLCRGSGT